MTRVRGVTSGRARWILPLLLASALPFLPVLSNGFVWDDGLYLTENTDLGRPGAAGFLRWAFTTFRGGNWHPLTWISHRLDLLLFGPGPFGPHLVNLLLHLAVTGLVLAVWRAATGRTGASAAMALLFAVHPLRVESVAWAAQRKDLLAALFALSAILLHLRHAARPSRGTLAPVFLAGAAALLSKPMAVTIPLLMLVLDCWPLGRLVRAGPRRPWGLTPLLLEKAPLLILSLGVGLVTLRAQGEAGAVTEAPPLFRLAWGLMAVRDYLGKSLLPADLAVLYPHPGTWPPAGGLAAAALLLSGITWLALRHRRAHPSLPAGWAWFLLALLPVLGVAQVGRQYMADRYTYLPSLGLLMAAVHAAGHLLPGRGRRGIAVLAAAAAFLSLSLLTHRQTRSWRDDESLYLASLAATGPQVTLLHNLAVHYQGRGRLAEAEEHYRRALAADPLYAESLNNLGGLLEARGDRRRALALYRRAAELRPDLPAPRRNLERLGSPPDPPPSGRGD
jgi:tetratricopeptide (TPR) repeat protein